MNIIKLSDNVGELEAVRDKAAEELQYLRSLDTAGDGKWFISRLLRTNIYLNKIFIYLNAIYTIVFTLNNLCKCVNMCLD